MDATTVCGRLTKTQREIITEAFCKANPHWRGAGVEDIIDTVDDHDHHIAEVEDAWDRFPQLRRDGFGLAVRCLVLAGERVNEENLQSLLDG